jgi:hypothetical protein
VALAAAAQTIPTPNPYWATTAHSAVPDYAAMWQSMHGRKRVCRYQRIALSVSDTSYLWDLQVVP